MIIAVEMNQSANYNGQLDPMVGQT